MKRRLEILVALAALFVPVAAAFGHTDTELGSPLGDQEIVVTGHHDLDPAPHAEGPSGVFVQQCPECVLDKRQSTTAPTIAPISGLRSFTGLIAVDRLDRPGPGPESRRSPRAPPHARFR